MDLNAFSKNLTQVYSRLQNGLQKNPREFSWRCEQLRSLKKLLEENDKALCQAMWKDLRKSEFECAATEQGVVLSEINFTLKNLKKWLHPLKVSTPLYNQLGTSHIYHEPLGLALIIGAWNYPINLLLAPLVAAIAGGNGAILKPSEISANTASLIAELIPKYLDPELFAVIQGGAEETGVLLDQKFDTIFFTGSGNVGKIILAKAAPHLTPVTLELGGKSPAMVMGDADLKTSARRIVWGKFMNAGQTCVAPDYVLVPPGIRGQFVQELQTALRDFFGADVLHHPDYCRIINLRNFDRLQALLKDLPLLHGGQVLRDQLFIAPTIVSAKASDPIMNEEIFGPILPILEMEGVANMTNFVNARPKPLALYLFTKDQRIMDQVTVSTSSGAICINDVVMHMPMPSLPFGGVGASGMGNYHGEFGFKTFTHAKGVLQKTTWPDIPVRYPPYTHQKAKWLKWLFK